MDVLPRHEPVQHRRPRAIASAAATILELHNQNNLEEARIDAVAIARLGHVFEHRTSRWPPKPNYNTHFPSSIPLHVATTPKAGRGCASATVSAPNASASPAARNLASGNALSPLPRRRQSSDQNLTDIGVRRCYLARMCEEGFADQGGAWTLSCRQHGWCGLIDFRISSLASMMGGLLRCNTGPSLESAALRMCSIGCSD